MNNNKQQIKDNSEWRNVIQLLPCKKQKSCNFERTSKKIVQSAGFASKSNPELLQVSKAMTNTTTNNSTTNNNNVINGINSSKQKDLIIVVNQDNQKTSSHSKNSQLPHPVIIPESEGNNNIDVIPITISEKQQGCQCTCVIV